MKPHTNTNNNNNTSTSNRNSNNSNTQGHNYQQGSHHDRRKQQPHHQQNRSQQQQQQQQQTQSNEQSHYQQYQRDRSGQRNQHPDSSMGRDTSMGHAANQSNLGAVRFTPGTSTRDLPPIETKGDSSKKFTGRCRLFIGNLAHNTTEEKLRHLFEPFGEVGEVFLGPKSAFAFIKMDTRQSAEAARDALDCSLYENRTLRVRLAAHPAAIRIKHLSPHVTNELLAYAFRYFGEVERAVIVVDDKGRSIGEGIIEFSRKQSALYAIKRCQQECFLLTASPKPVLVELYDQHDEDEGLPEKSVNRNSIEYKEQRDVGPRFAEQGTFEHDFGLRWKELYEVEKQKRDRLEQEIQEARKKLQDQIEYSRLEHNEMQLRSQLQQLEDNRMKLRQMKEQEVTDAQQQEDRRRQQDMLIRQREEEILRRQQLSDPTSLNMNLNMNLNQQESTLRMQASALQDILNNQDYDDSNDANHAQQKPQATGSQVGSEAETNMHGGHQLNMMASQLASQPRTFADAAMMSMSQQSYIPVQQMAMHPSTQNPQMNAPNMFTSFMQPQQQMQLPIDTTNLVQVQTYPMMAQQQQHPQLHQQQLQQAAPSNSGRQQKFGRPHNAGNNIVVQSGGSARPRKRGKF